MDPSTEQYGIDAQFTSDVPDYVKCVACQMVLRDPLQFLDCGHKICTPCFKRLKQYSGEQNTVLQCPLDREEVEMHKVVADNGARRIVGNLPVKCWNDSEGCKWTGDLRDLEQHQLLCEYRKVEAEPMDQVGPRDDALLKALIQRISGCENMLQGKEKDIASLTQSLTKLNNVLNEKLGEMDYLKYENEIIKEKMKDFDKLEVKFENLSLKQAVLEQKFETQGNDLLETKRKLEEKEEVISALQNSIAFSTEEGGNGYDDDDDNDGDGYDEDDDDDDEDYEDDIGRLEETVEKMERRFSEFEGHLSNLENMIFCDYGDSNEIKFEWVLQNYQHHYDIGQRVESPKFFTHFKDYRFSLLVQWSGKKKGLLGIFLCLHRAEPENNRTVLDSFDTSYTLTLSGYDGSNLSKTVNPKNMSMEDKNNYFRISAGKDDPDMKGYGFSEFVTGSRVNKYVVNDRLYVTCTLNL